MGDMPWRTLRRLSRSTVKHKVDLTVEGMEHLPETGPVLLAARHFHHLYDGAAILATIPRPTHIVVGLDWMESPVVRTALPRLCRAARWPVVYRTDPAGDVPLGQRTAALHTATRDVLDLLAEGRVVVMFPEGYPNIDPGHTPKVSDSDFLPFSAGVVRLAEIARRQGLDVPIVPVGLQYVMRDQRSVAMRFGAPRYVLDRRAGKSVLADLEGDVRRLSGFNTE